MPSPSPVETVSEFVAWTSALFYWAEVGHNERVKTYWDAVHYIATSLSVGYANIFPETQLGKLIGAVAMMVGPALSSKALDGLAPARPEEPSLTTALVERLDAMLAELKKISAALPAASGQG
jgi:hypothetical protein